MTTPEVLDFIVIPAAIASSLGVGAAVVCRRSPGRIHAAFAAGMVALALEASATFVLLTRTETPATRLLWLQVTHALGLLVPLPWACFLLVLTHLPGHPVPRVWRGVFVGGGTVLAGAAAGVVSTSAFDIAAVAAPFYAARLGGAAAAGVALQLLATIAILGGLEGYLRSASPGAFWRNKYLMLGVAAIFLARFYFLSQALLFRVVMASPLRAQAALLLVANLAIGASLVRSRLREAEIAVSPAVLYRSAVVAVLGCYLVTVAVLGWVLVQFDIPEELFWTSFLVFVSALALAALLLSANARWRLRRFLSMHFYRSKYDYREQWITFTNRLGSLLSLDELTPHLLTTVTAAVGAAKGAVFLADDRDGSFHVAGTVEISRPAPVLHARSSLIARLQAPLVLDGSDADGLVPAFVPPGSVAVPLVWRGTLSGVMLIGPERTGARYSAEDFEFLRTIAEQAAGAIVTARVSEALARSREFETFHRLTSFVIHDVKNSISALSMLSENALENFDDPEFQRDALTTLSRTVDRMKRLLARLSAAPEGGTVRFEPVDLGALVLEATRPLQRGSVAVVTDLAPVRPVQGDADALLRVLQNLVANAVESLRGGEGVVTVRMYEAGDAVVCEVSDTGCGMSEEFLRTSLFTPFRSTKRGGWGIGLYNARTIVESHGGAIDVSSKEHVGTTVHLRLPLSHAASRAS